MTLIYADPASTAQPSATPGAPPVQGVTATPAVHAFIIGSSAYPEAKPGHGFSPLLRNVPDIAAAAAGAMLVADWLIDNRNALDLPLGSVEVLLDENAPTPYAWRSRPAGAAGQPPVRIDQPSVANVNAAGANWVQRLSSCPGNIAFFYICGHGGALQDQQVVFLHDLNASQVSPWGAFINIHKTAISLKQQTDISAAFFYADSCREFIPQFNLLDVTGEAVFMPRFDPFLPGKERVSLITAASNALLAFDGPLPAPDQAISVGRFTQVLLTALGGASARRKGGKWVINPLTIQEDILPLYSLRADWPAIAGKPFEPCVAISPNQAFPIVYPTAPSVPVVTITAPDSLMAQCDLTILDNGLAVLDARPPGAAGRWVSFVKASELQHTVRATYQNQPYQAYFFPREPIFDQKVAIP